MSLYVFVLMSSLLHGYIAWRLLPPLWAWPPVSVALALLLAVSALMLPLTLVFMRRRPRRGGDALQWVGMTLLGLFSSLLIATLSRELLLVAAWLSGWGGVAAWSAALAAGGALLVTGWGFVNARRTAAVVDVEVPLAGLPAALHGFTIAQISDIHVGATIKHGYLRAIVDKVNRMGADMVAVTGDLVDGSVPELGHHVAALAGLSSRHGTFFVTGNHEYYSGAHAWIAELRRIGVRVLLNEHVVLTHDAARLVVAGVADYSAHHFDPAHRSDPHAALAGAPARDEVPRVLLAHQPRSAAEAERAGAHVQLSGHTHGGQFWPWNLFVPLQQPFTAGLHRLRDLWVYVSRGTGYWGPPKRFGAPSEITRLKLVRA